MPDSIDEEKKEMYEKEVEEEREERRGEEREGRKEVQQNKRSIDLQAEEEDAIECRTKKRMKKKNIRV